MVQACEISGLASSYGLEVIAVNPSKASIDYARTKPFAHMVNWLVGNATTLPQVEADLAVMTGNVAQVFLTDESWALSLRAIRSSLRPEGFLVFETQRRARGHGVIGRLKKLESVSRYQARAQ